MGSTLCKLKIYERAKTSDVGDLPFRLSDIISYTTICFFCHMTNDAGSCAAANPIKILI